MYNFLEAPPNSNSWPLNALSSLVYTNRTINSTYSCKSYTVNPVSGNGSSNFVDVFLSGANAPSTTITVPSVVINETTFFLDNGTCGSRCGFISVFQASFTTPQFYQCNITISEVANATLPQHLVNDAFAQLVARAIALGATSSNGFYQRYPEDSNYGILIEADADAMGKQMAYFAICAVAVAYLSNPSVVAAGRTPEQAYTLHIHSSTKLVLVFVLVSGAQLLLSLATAVVAVARLLRPVVARLGPAGRRICDVLEMEDTGLRRGPPMMLIYTARRYDAEGSRARLVLGEGTRERAFKSGRYD